MDREKALRSAMTDKEPDVAAELAYMAEHHEQFTKKEMAAMLAAASVVIEDLLSLVGVQAAIALEDIEPEGNA